MKKVYDSTGVKMDGEFEAAPEGMYDLLVAKITDTKDGEPWKTKNGDDYVSVECEIANGEWQGKKIWHGVTFMDDTSRKGAGMAIHFLKSIGEPWQGKFDIDTDNWPGKIFRAKLKVGKDNQGRPRNEIAYLVSEDKPETDDDAVPF